MDICLVAGLKFMVSLLEIKPSSYHGGHGSNCLQICYLPSKFTEKSAAGYVPKKRNFFVASIPCSRAKVDHYDDGDWGRDYIKH